MLETRFVAPRIRPLGHSAQSETEVGGVTVQMLPPGSRFSLRVRRPPTDVAGFRLDQGINRAAVHGERTSLRLGPDEWFLLGPEADTDVIAAELEAALADRPHALVDVGHRNVAFEIAGAEAAVALNAGCPLDLDPRAFPAGSATRTILGKAEVVLYRPSEDARFVVECWRSFAPYVHGFLLEGAHGLG